MNKKTFRMSILTLISTLSSIGLLCGFGNISIENKYSCAGKIDNGMVITREFPTLHFSGKQLKITGSDVFSSYKYLICNESVSLISFATQQELCPAKQVTNMSLQDSYGSLNKVTGELSLLGSQGLNGYYQCKLINNN